MPVAGETFGADPQYVRVAPEMRARSPARPGRGERTFVGIFLVALAVSFGVIFVPGLGDKSQLMALTFATRYRAWPVLLGISAATAVVHAVSVVVGYLLGAALPTFRIHLASAVAFLVFGLWTLRGDGLSRDEEEKADRTGRSAVL